MEKDKSNEPIKIITFCWTSLIPCCSKFFPLFEQRQKIGINLVCIDRICLDV